MLRCGRVYSLVVGLAFGLSGAGLDSRAQAQSKQPVKVEPVTAFGSVTGHVYLAGSNAPARFAKVALQPFDVKDPAPAGPGKMGAVPFTVYQTDLLGAFRIDRVKPGTYYVVVNAPGCMSPFALFTKEELQNPSAEVAKRIASAVPAVRVQPNATATLTLRLRRGASLSGTVRFDDGTAFAQASVSIQKRGSDGKWAAPRATDAWGSTDTDGQWTIDGLPPGEYRVQVDLRVEEMHKSALLGDNGSSWNNSTYSLPVYLGDTVRETEAKTATLEEGQQMDGQNITVPVSRMHTIAGALVDARTGQALNAGHVALVYADSGKELVSATVDPETNTFALPFVMEGEYKLTTKDAREVRYEETGDPDNDPFHQNRKEVLLRGYGPGEVPVVVQGEMSGVTLPVEAKTAKGQ